jgi:hypothetical protein
MTSPDEADTLALSDQHQNQGGEARKAWAWPARMNVASGGAAQSLGVALLPEPFIRRIAASFDWLPLAGMESMGP